MLRTHQRVAWQLRLSACQNKATTSPKPHLELGVGEGLARLLQAVLVLVLPIVDDLGALVEQQHLLALADPGAGVQRRLRTTGGEVGTRGQGAWSEAAVCTVGQR